MRKLWLIFAQTATICLAVLFVVNTLRPELLASGARPGMLTLLEASHAIRRVGNVWLTATDNIVVPGRGYSGASPSGALPDADQEWLYASAMVTVLRDSISYPVPQAERTAENPMGIPKQVVDRPVNDIMVIAERIVAVTYDSSCCQLAAQAVRSV